MSRINDILGTGRQGVLTHKQVLDVISRNISNAQTEGYTRQTPVLTPLSAPQLGVMLAQIKRTRDMVLEGRIRSETQDLKKNESEINILKRIERLFSEDGGGGLTNELSALFDAFEALSTHPDSVGVRRDVVAKSSNFLSKAKNIAQAMVDLRTEQDKTIQQTIKEVNSILSEIATLNAKIAENEKVSQTQPPGANINEIKDKRDLLVRKLSEIIDIQTFQDDLGRTIVSLSRGGHVLVSADRAFSLTTMPDLKNTSNPIDSTSSPLVAIKYVDGDGKIWNITPFIQGGKLGGILSARDTSIVSILTQLNALSKAITESVGRIHTQGVGIVHYSSLTSQYNSDPAATLSSSGLPYSSSSGSFNVAVYTEDGSYVTSFTVNYDPTIDNLYNISLFVNSNPENSGYVSSSVSADGKLTITAGDGYKFDLYKDTGGLLTSLGLDTLFVGKNIFEMKVGDDFVSEPLFIATSDDPLSPAGNNVALQLAELRNSKILNSKSALENYLDIQSQIGHTLFKLNIDFDAKKSAVSILDEQIQAEAGVSLDEEFAKVIEFQRAFDASARLVRMSDEMMLTILGLGAGG